MACVLTNTPTIDADCQGPKGVNFTVDVACDDPNVVVDISAASYAKTTLTAGPFTFAIVEGVSNLALILEATDRVTLMTAVGAVIKVVEICPNGPPPSQPLRQVDMTHNDHVTTGFLIEGV